MLPTRWINAAVGAVLVCTGLLASGAERANNLTVGLAIFVVAFLAMASPRMRRVNTLLGGWAVFSPFVLGYRADLAGWTALGGGVVVVVASLWPDRAPEGRAQPVGPGAA